MNIFPGYIQSATDILKPRAAAASPDDYATDKSDYRRVAQRLLSPLTIVAICFYLMVFVGLIYLRKSPALLGNWGYSGVVLLVIVAAVVATLGGLTGYVLGARTRNAIRRQGIYGRLVPKRRWIGPCLFAFSILPGPFIWFTVWAGRVDYPLWRFLLFVTTGKTVKLTGLAFVGYHSIPWLLKPLA